MPYPDAATALQLAPYPKELDLKFVEIVHRHGERTPVSKTVSAMFGDAFNGKCKLTPFLHAIYSFQEMRSDDSESFPDKENFPSVALNGVPSIDPVLENPLKTDGVSTLMKGRPDLMTVKHLRQVIGDGSCFSGQLTDIGKQTMREIGTRLRGVYLDKLDLLPKDPETGKAKYSDSVYVRSTDYARTIESVQYLLAGLNSGYTLAFDDKTFKIHTREAQYETMYPHPKCSKLNTLTKEFRDANYTLLKPTALKLLEDMKPIIPDLAEGSKFKGSPILLLHAIYDSAVCAKAHGIPLPKEITEDRMKTMDDITVRMWWRSFGSTPRTTALSLGRFLPELYGKMEKVAEGDSKLKMAIFSGHDSTIGPLLFSLRAFDGIYPPFASMINIELFKKKYAQGNAETPASTNGDKKDGHFVRFLYNGKPLLVPHCLKKGMHYEGKLDGIEDNRQFCALKAFADISNAYGSGFTKKNIKAGDWEWYERQCADDKKNTATDWDDSGL